MAERGFGVHRGKGGRGMKGTVHGSWRLGGKR